MHLRSATLRMIQVCEGRNAVCVSVDKNNTKPEPVIIFNGSLGFCTVMPSFTLESAWGLIFCICRIINMKLYLCIYLYVTVSYHVFFSVPLWMSLTNCRINLFHLLHLYTVIQIKCVHSQLIWYWHYNLVFSYH